MKRRRHNWSSILRDLFLGSIALVILYDQVFQVAAKGKAVQPILIFLVIFLFGSIPALRGDGRGGRPSTFARVIMTLLGVTFPQNYDEDEKGSPPSGGSSADGQKPSPGGRHAGSSQSSSKSSPPSTKGK